MITSRLSPAVMDSSELPHAYEEFAATVVRRNSVDPMITELVRLRCAHYHDCRLCGSVRLVDAVRAGLDEQVVSTIDSYETSDFDPRWKAALRLTDAVIVDPTGVGPELAAQLRSFLEPLAAHYFLKARTPKGRLIDSVARFHLGNGARLERIDWLGDLSPKGLRESAGIMVNYLYRLEDIEKNHEAYANQGEVAASSAVKKLLKSEGRRLLDMRLS